MIGWRFEFSTLSDLSATIFSVFLLLLVLLADSAINPRQVEGEVMAVDRKPLDAPAMAELLYQRRVDAEGTRIDVMTDHIVVITRSGTVTLPAQALSGPLRTGRVDDPVSLYVFSNQSYAPAVTAINAYGRTWREISVPAALRRKEGSAQEGWTEDFLELLARSRSKENFVQGLAVILGGGSKRVNNDFIHQYDGKSLGGYSQEYRGFLSYIMSLWTVYYTDAMVTLLLGVTGIVVIALIERRWRACM